MLLALKLSRKRRHSISGKGNQLKNEGVFLNVSYDIEGNNNQVIVQKGSIISDTLIYMRGDNHQLIIHSNCKYRGGSFHFEDDSCLIELGEGTTVESAHLAATEPGKKIVVGKDCMLSTDIVFRTGDSHSIIDRQTGKRINHAKDIKIGNHVWIGANATVLKGVNIDDNSIISSGAIVTASVPANSIAGGIPAKVLKNDVNWLREKIYTE